MAKLQEAWTLDVHAKHADAANLLGVRPEEVILRRDPAVAATKVQQNADGVWEITAPERRAHRDVLDDIWKARQEAPGAPAERPKPLERGSYEPTFSADEVIAVGKPVMVGNRIESRGDADALMQALADGDRKALKGLGLGTLPKGFDPRSVEWGLGVLPDGKYVIIRGDHGAVDWAPFPEVRALAHTHPLRSGKYLRPDGGGVGVRVVDMIEGGGVNELNKVSFFPSAADVAFCVRNALATHTVHTHVRPTPATASSATRSATSRTCRGSGSRSSARSGSARGRASTHIPAYQAHLVVRDADGAILWQGDMIAVHHPSTGSVIQFGPPPARWLKPGLGTAATAGGATPTPTRAPANELEELALADWQRLEHSGKDYGGKFDSDVWYERYNEGLRYDLDRKRLVPAGRAQGQRAAEVRRPEALDQARGLPPPRGPDLGGRPSSGSPRC